MRQIARSVAILLLMAAPAVAATAPHVQALAGDEPPPQVRELLERLDDPVVREWLAQRRAGMSASGEAAPAMPAQPADISATVLLEQRIAAIREHIAALVAALPTLPGELARVGGVLLQELQEFGLFSVILLLAVFVALGFGAEWLFWRAMAGARRRTNELRLESVGDRVRAVVMRLMFGAGEVLAFALGSVGAFLAFAWPPLLRQIVLVYLVAFLALRVPLVLGRFLLAPPSEGASANNEHFRVVPMSDAAARFWYRRVGLLVGWYAFGYATVIVLGALGLPLAHRQLVAYILGLGLLVMGVEIAWRRPGPGLPVDANAAAGVHRFGHNAGAWLLSAYFLLLWVLWVASAMNAFWLAVVAVALPVAIRLAQRAVKHLLRPPGAAVAEAGVPSVRAVILERGLRTALVIGGVLFLAQKWDVDLVALTATDSQFTRMIRGVLSAIVILLIADFAWHVLRAIIDSKLVEAQDPGQPDTEEARHRARVRTLLPIIRNVVLIVMIAMAAMMALASMGVEIGPLIAGAGVVGVAIGFGAQTLVRDVISGMFYLLDDAFRVGEYIQSGSYKGTVESFSLRSVKLRHHRGPLYTVPFGVLGAVQNMSRDWVIDKLTVGVTYDSDLEKARKLVKQIGKELADDPEFAPHILQPLKMQGVEQFGDYAIQLRMKMMTRPGEQFAIRRRAYGMIKKAFDANGIKFAFPTVQVAGEAETATAAAARQALALVQPAPAAR